MSSTPPGRALVAPERRRFVAAIVAADLAVFAAISIPLAHTEGPTRLDNSIGTWLTAHARGHLAAARHVADLGGPVPSTVMVLLLFVGAVLMRRPRWAVLVAIASPVSTFITEVVLKPLVHRTFRGGDSFPSGHATSIFTIAFVIVVLMLGPSGAGLRARTRRLIVAAALLVAVVVAVALVAARFHFASDTVGGAAVALATVLGLALLIDAVAQARIVSKRFDRAIIGR